MKGLFRILISALFSCIFFSNVSAEEKVSREQVDSLVARVLRNTLLYPEIQFIIKDNESKGDKLIREYISFRRLSDAVYEQMRELPASEIRDKINFAGSYVYFRLTSHEFWKTFRQYVDAAENDRKFDFAIRDSRFAGLAESIGEDFPCLMERALKKSVIPLEHGGIYWEKVLKISRDKIPVLLVKTLMEYFSYEEFKTSRVECLDVCQKIENGYLEYCDILLKKVDAGQAIDSVLNDRSSPDGIAEYMKLSRTPLFVSNGLYRPVKELRLKQGQYEGGTYDGVPDGEGTLTDKKGVKYFGAFRNGLRHGPVFLLEPEKEAVMQVWYDGKLRKDVSVSLRTDGSVPEAVIIDGKLFGYGGYYNRVNKSTHVGFFIDGEQCGPGEIVTPEYTLRGKFYGSRIHDCVIEWNGTKYQKNKFVGIKNGNLRKGVLHRVSSDGRHRVWKGEFVDDAAYGDVADGDMVWCSMSDKDTSRYFGLFAYGSMYGEGKIEYDRVLKDGMREVCRFKGNTIRNRAYGEGSFEISFRDFPKNKFSINRFGVKLLNLYTEGKDTVTVKAEGIFHDNKLVEGKVTVSNGTYMQGKFSDGVLAQGRLVKRYADGSSYDGECRNGRYHGYGRIVYPDGTAYEGRFEDGKPVGIINDGGVSYRPLVSPGTKTRTYAYDNLANKNGVVSLVKAAGVKIMVRGMSSVEVTCTGRFNGEIMTYGKVSVSDGTWLEGTFEDGVLIKGKGKTLDKYGTVYVGDIKNGFPHGQGKCTYTDGTWFKGNFASGNRMDGVHYAADGKVIKVYQK